jgi:hypothetical protein
MFSVRSSSALSIRTGITRSNGALRWARSDWERQAEEALGEQIDQEGLAALRAEAASRLSELDDAIANINERLQLAAGDRFTLPRIDVPSPRSIKTPQGKGWSLSMTIGWRRPAP